MINPQLFFGLSLEYDVTKNEQLKKLSALRFWDKGNKEYVYIFNISRLREVIALLSKEVSFEGQASNIEEVLEHCPNIKYKVQLPGYKGEGETEVVWEEGPNVFIVSQYQRKKKVSFTVPLETVVVAWDVCKALGEEKRLSKELAEFWCLKLGIKRFHKETGSWQGDKMYGSRKVYMHWYCSLKILQHFNLIEYSKRGYISKLKECWEWQGKVW